MRVQMRAYCLVCLEKTAINVDKIQLLHGRSKDSARETLTVASMMLLHQAETYFTFDL